MTLEQSIKGLIDQRNKVSIELSRLEVTSNTEMSFTTLTVTGYKAAQLMSSLSFFLEHIIYRMEVINNKEIEIEFRNDSE